MSPEITRDEWLKALGEAVAPPDPEALTTRELAEMLGIPRKTMDNRIRLMVDQGKAMRTVKVVTTAQGTRRVMAYKLVR
jgi:hypothetical protein